MTVKFSRRYRNSELTFESIPGSLPPTNVHAIIGHQKMSVLAELAKKDIPFDRVLTLSFSPFSTLHSIESEETVVHLGMVDLLAEADTGIAEDYLLGLPGFDDEVVRESSGNTVVLHAVAGLLRNLRKRTLVLIYEPETHLDFALQSTFMHALHMLLPPESIAVVATQSPVILREIPRSCVWSMRRYGGGVADRPESETYGEGIGTLASEAFHLQMYKIGHYALIENAAKGRTYEEAKELFGGNLGGNAKAHLMVHCIHEERRAQERVSKAPQDPSVSVSTEDIGDVTTPVMFDTPKVQRRVSARKVSRVVGS